MTSEAELKPYFESYGYTLYRVVHFKNHDRLHFGNQAIKVTLNLRGKLSQLALEAVLKACIGEETKT